VPSRVVKPPRVAESPVNFECKVHSILRVTGDSLVGHSDIVIGRVVAIHVKGEYITPDGVSETQNHLISSRFSMADFSKLFDVLKAAPLARLGYHQYTAINNIFDMEMPFMPDDHVSGFVLGGAAGGIEPGAENQLKEDEEPVEPKLQRIRSEGH